MVYKQVKLKKIWLVWILTVVLSLQAAACALLQGEEYRADPKAKVVFRVEDDTGIAKAQLDPQETLLYDEIDLQLQNYADKISVGLDEYSDETIVKVYFYVLIDHPEYFWLRDAYLLKTATSLFDRKKVLEPFYAIPRDEIDACKERVERVRDEILQAVEAMPSDYEKLLYIHDYIVSTTRYDTEAYTDIDTETPSARSLESTTAYGVLINKWALCGGYAKAFQYLAEAAGIRCTTVTGHKKDGESHIWNIVVLDGDCYYVDVTWDDPVSIVDDAAFDDKGEIFYNYFCITEKELLKTHIIDGEQNIAIPGCTAVKYNYFIYHNAYLETYTLRAAAEIIKTAASAAQKMAYLKFAEAEAMDLAIKELFGEREIFEILADAGCETGTASYSRDDEHYILTVDFGYV